MLIAVIITAYLIGYLLSYLWLRAIVRNRRQEDWLLLEKLVVITISLFSFLAIGAVLLLIILGSSLKIDFDKKCTW